MWRESQKPEHRTAAKESGVGVGELEKKM